MVFGRVPCTFFVRAIWGSLAPLLQNDARATSKLEPKLYPAFTRSRKRPPFLVELAAMRIRLPATSRLEVSSAEITHAASTNLIILESIG